MLLITGFQNGMSLALVARAPVRLAAEVVCPSPQCIAFRVTGGRTYVRTINPFVDTYVDLWAAPDRPPGFVAVVS